MNGNQERFVPSGAEELTARIEGAFAEVPYPARGLVDGHDGESIEIADAFRLKRWQDLDIDFLCHAHMEDIFLLSDEAFRYFLPGYMKVSVLYYDQADLVPDCVVHALTMPGPEDWREDDPKILFHDKIDFLRKMRPFTAEQKRVIREFLEYMDRVHGEDYPDHDPKVALQRYWESRKK